jgi:hypothetical protein
MAGFGMYIWVFLLAVAAVVAKFYMSYRRVVRLEWPTESPVKFRRACKQYFSYKGWKCESADFPLDFKIISAKETYSIRCEGGNRPMMETLISDMRRMKQTPNRFIIMSREMTVPETAFTEKHSIKTLNYKKLNEEDVLHSMRGF